MALMLAGGKSDEERLQDEQLEEDSEDSSRRDRGKQKIVGRLLEDDPAEKAAAAARHAAAARNAAESSPSELAASGVWAFQGRMAIPRRVTDRSQHRRAKWSAPPDAGRTGSRPIGPDRRTDIADHGASPDRAAVRDRASTCSATARIAREAREAHTRCDGAGVPLRELVLAWYEVARLSRVPGVASRLAHRAGAASSRRCSTGICIRGAKRSACRSTASPRLIEQAREIGMMRVAVIAEAGYESGAKEIAKSRHVRLIDRSTMEAELSELQLPMAAKIIAIARKRSAAESPAASLPS